MFKVACGAKERGGWEIALSEFWKMTPAQWWALWDFNVGNEIRAERQTMDRLKRLYWQSKEADAK